jgi:DNA-binding NarL/FixJ family response regulator
MSYLGRPPLAGPAGLVGATVPPEPNPAAVRVARKKMRALGVRSVPVGPRTATRAHPLGLTRREHEVLDLIVAGHTNAGIAEQPFISAKTVDHHVPAVLAKLGAPSRNAAAAETVRLGLARAAP